MNHDNKKGLKLDNSAIIHIASMRKNWINEFCLRATLSAPIDEAHLQKALDIITPRFPTIASKIEKRKDGFYSVPLEKSPKVKKSDGLIFKNLNKYNIYECAISVSYFENNIYLEVFHSLTDGYGGIIFLKTLLSQYLKLEYKINIPISDSVLDCDVSCSKEETEDSFFNIESPNIAKYKRDISYKLTSATSNDDEVYFTTKCYDIKDVIKKTKENNTTIGVLFTSFLMYTLFNRQRSLVPKNKRQPIKIMMPINLRNLYSSKTLLNFSYFINTSLDGKSIQNNPEEIIENVSNQINSEITAAHLASRIAFNLKAEKSAFMRYMPPKLKVFLIKSAFKLYGECSTCMTLSNLGVITVPDEMKNYVNAIIGVASVRANTPYNCVINSFDDKLYITFSHRGKDVWLIDDYIYNLEKIGLFEKSIKNTEEPVPAAAADIIDNKSKVPAQYRYPNYRAKIIYLLGRIKRFIVSFFPLKNN